jgi:WD40 repeat protein/tetratricopeptide (TPR) repeat protein
MGKSTLLANWADRCRRRLRGDAGESIHMRFIGVGERSNSVRDLLRYLLLELRDAAHKLDEGDEIPADPNELRQKWPALLAKAAQKGKTILLFDALNQLDSGLTDLNWLMRELPPGLKLVVSFKLGAEVGGDALCQEMEQDRRVQIARVRPFESLEDRRKLVRAFLELYLKNMDDRYLDLLIQLKGAHSPLYLKVVLFELRVFGAFEQLKAKIERDFGETPELAFQAVLTRLESDPSYSFLAPEVAVPLIFGLMAHSRRGLSVGALSEILFQQQPKKNLMALIVPAQDENDRERMWVQDSVQLFLRQVRTFLARRKGHYDFFYDSFRKAANASYVAPASGHPSARKSAQWHQILAAYCRDWHDLQGAEKEYALENIVYHHLEAEDSSAAASLLMDFALLYQRLATLGKDAVVSIDNEYRQILYLLPNSPKREQLERWALLWFEAESTMARDGVEWRPEIQFLQRAYGSSELGGIAKATETWMKEQGANHSWIRSLRRPQEERFQGKEQVYYGHNAPVTSVAVGLGGTLISASQDHTVHVWDMERNRSTLCYNGHKGPVLSAALTRDASLAVTCGQDYTVQVWDLHTGKCHAHLTPPPKRWHNTFEWIMSALVTDDGQTLVVGTAEGILHSWDLSSKQLLPSVQIKNSVLNMVACEGSQRIYIGTKSKCYSYVPGSLEAELLLDPGIHMVHCTAARLRERLILTGEEGTVVLIESSHPLSYHVLPGHSADVLTSAMDDEGNTALTIDADGWAILWDLDPRTIIKRFRIPSGLVKTASWLPGERRVVLGVGNQVEIWNVDIAAPRKQLTENKRPRNLAADAAFERLAYSLEHRVEIDSLGEKVSLNLPFQTEKVISCIAMSPDGHMVAVGDRAGKVHLWSLEESQVKGSLPLYNDEVRAIAFSADGRNILVGGNDKLLQWIDLEKMQCLRQLEGHDRWVSSVALMQTGSLAISGGGDRVVRLWDTQDGRCIKSFEEHKRPILSIAASADFQRFFTGTAYWAGLEDFPLHCLDARSGDFVWKSAGHKDAVFDLCLLSELGILVSVGGGDMTVRFWDANSGDNKAVWVAENAVMRCVGSKNRVACLLESGEVLLLEYTLPGRVVLEMESSPGREIVSKELLMSDRSLESLVLIRSLRSEARNAHDLASAQFIYERILEIFRKLGKLESFDMETEREEIEQERAEFQEQSLQTAVGKVRAGEQLITLKEYGRASEQLSEARALLTILYKSGMPSAVIPLSKCLVFLGQATIKEGHCHEGLNLLEQGISLLDNKANNFSRKDYELWVELLAIARDVSLEVGEIQQAVHYHAAMKPLFLTHNVSVPGNGGIPSHLALPNYDSDFVDALSNIRAYEEALCLSREVISQIEQINKGDMGKYIFGNFYMQRGELARELKHKEEALEALLSAINSYEQALEKGSIFVRRSLALCRLDVGQLLFQSGRQKDGQVMFLEGLTLLQILIMEGNSDIEPILSKAKKQFKSFIEKK